MVLSSRTALMASAGLTTALSLCSMPELVWAQGQASVNLGEISDTATRDQAATPGNAAQGTPIPAAAPEASNSAAVEERRFGEARERIFTKAGATVTTLDRSAIEAQPQGDNQQ